MYEVELPTEGPTKEPNPDFSQKFLLAMVFDAGNSKGMFQSQEVATNYKAKQEKFVARKIYRMQSCGLHTFTYKSESGDEIICLINVIDQDTSVMDKALNLLRYSTWMHLHVSIITACLTYIATNYI